MNLQWNNSQIIFHCWQEWKEDKPPGGGCVDCCVDCCADCCVSVWSLTDAGGCRKARGTWLSVTIAHFIPSRVVLALRVSPKGNLGCNKLWFLSSTSLLLIFFNKSMYFHHVHNMKYSQDSDSSNCYPVIINNSISINVSQVNLLWQWTKQIGQWNDTWNQQREQEVAAGFFPPQQQMLGGGEYSSLNIVLLPFLICAFILAGNFVFHSSVMLPSPHWPSWAVQSLTCSRRDAVQSTDTHRQCPLVSSLFIQKPKLCINPIPCKLSQWMAAWWHHQHFDSGDSGNQNCCWTAASSKLLVTTTNIWARHSTWQ